MMLTSLTILMTLAPISFYIGTYTSPKASQGIYYATLDPTTGQISTPTLAVQTQNPSFLAMHPTKPHLYAANETAPGQASAYKINPDSTLTHLNSQDARGNGTCHISFILNSNLIAVANYSTGSITTFPVNPNGSLQPHKHTYKNKGSGPNSTRQSSPHAHAATPHPTNKHFYTCDLGTDQVLVFHPNQASPIQKATLPPGSGPRHITFHPNGKTAYVNNELTNALTILIVNPDASLTPVNTQPNLPTAQITPQTSTSEIALHPTNPSLLYISNRGHNSITLFKLNQDGTPTYHSNTPAQVHSPRTFAFSPDGKWLLIAGQQSHSITSFKVDPTTGTLTPTTHKVTLNRPVCIAFAPQS